MVSEHSILEQAPSILNHAHAQPSTQSNPDEHTKAASQGLMEAVKLKPRHGRTPSDSSASQQSSSFDEERPSQDEDDLDNTPATSYGGFLSSRSDASAGPKSDCSHLSNVVLINSGLSVSSEDPSRMDELTQEVEALFEKFLPDFQAQQDDSSSEEAQLQNPPTLLSRNLPAILSEFERQRDHPLIDPKVYSQLEVFADENPEVPISSNMLVNLIHALESSAHSAISDDLDLHTSPVMDRQASHSTGNDSTPIAASEELLDLSHDEHLIRDSDNSRDSSRELSAEATAILNLKEDLRIERDKNDALQQTLSDKERRVHTLEHKLTTSQEQYEELMLEEQAKLEDLYKQIQTLRREDKELRTKHFELQEQNNAYESQLTALNAQIEGAEKTTVKLRRDLEEESSQLIKAKADLDRRVKEAKELSGYLIECEQVKDAAEQTSGQLRQELEKVRAEAGKLQGYKEETEELRTTVDKLEMELDEVRRMTSMHSKESSAQPHSNPSTITRRLGNELARSMELDGHSSGEETQVDGKDADTSNVDDYIETVIQRRRRRVGKTRRSVEMVTQSIQTDSTEEPLIGMIVEELPAKMPTATHAKTNLMPLHTVFSSFSAALSTRKTSIVVLLFAIGLALGLMLNTSRDIYHISHQSLDADEFRKLNHLPGTSQTFYYDGRYPNAVVGSNFLDDYIGPVLDTMLSLIGGGTSSRPQQSSVVY
ncbi:hypothetical protein EX895_000767 [Sporisorium graminicola]|uniref:Uncharacterized protein n=1 Tax=Sporisorium graminicola TaxID=280036 RepID=A0A4V6YER7_9BASI|nr:hypothetical protein EX895_000767 [Sporisorium graminicola]TKY90769.1 hypothetical protein EX895_000767 [Sporisorium graminicola]